jgi:TP901 family phage tail tape measure protein
MYDLASAGMDTNQILAATEHAMKLAGATGSEMSQATGVLAASLKQFGLEAEQSKRVVDTFAQAITSSQLTMERLTQAMKFAGTTGAALGWDIEETTAAVAQFANLGLEGSMAGTNLRMAMISLSRQTSKVVNTLAELGLTFEDVNPETHTFGELLETVGKRAITGKQAVELFGSRAGLNMKRLAEAAAGGTLAFDEFVQKLRESQEGAGRANEMYERLMNTFRGQWKIVLSAAQELLINIFDTLEKPGLELLKSLKQSFDELSQWVTENKDEMISFWKIVAGWIEVASVMAVSLGKAMANMAATIAATPQLISPEGIDIGEAGGPGAGLTELMEYYRKLQAGIPETGDFPIDPGVKDRLADLKAITEQKQQQLDIDEELYRKTHRTDAELKVIKDKTQALWEQLAPVQTWAQLTYETQMMNMQMIEEVKAMEKEAADEMIKHTEGWAQLTAETQQMVLGFAEEKVAAERAAQEAILQARVDSSSGVFGMLRSQHELELAMDAQKNADLITQLEDAGVETGVIKDVIAAQDMARTKKVADHDRTIQETRLKIANMIASQMSATADALYQSGVIKGKKAFAALKAIKIVEAVIHTATAIIKTLGEPMLPFPSNVVMAAMIGAMGAAQVYAISQQQPPAYAEGGIVRGRQDGRGRMIRAGEYGDELVVPLRGGKVPVAMVGGGGTGGTQTVERHEHYHFDNATFMDQATLAASMETIAVAGVRKDYRNDGPTRSMIRSRR